MKTLGELRVGDPIYFIYYSDEGDCILSVKEHTIAIITEIAVGHIIKWIDNHGDLHAATLLKEENESYIARAFYGCRMCADLNFVINVVNDDKNSQIKKYNKIIKELTNENES